MVLDASETLFKPVIPTSQMGKLRIGEEESQWTGSHGGLLAVHGTGVTRYLHMAAALSRIHGTSPYSPGSRLHALQAPGQFPG